jgi:hypothetical protein
MKLTIANSVFKDAPVVSVAAKPGGSEVDQASLPVGKFGPGQFAICFMLVSCLEYSLALKTEVIHTSEMLGFIQITGHYNPEGHTHQITFKFSKSYSHCFPQSIGQPLPEQQQRRRLKKLWPADLTDG